MLLIILKKKAFWPCLCVILLQALSCSASFRRCEPRPRPRFNYEDLEPMRNFTYKSSSHEVEMEIIDPSKIIDLHTVETKSANQNKQTFYKKLSFTMFLPDGYTTFLQKFNAFHKEEPAVEEVQLPAFPVDILREITQFCTFKSILSLAVCNTQCFGFFTSILKQMLYRSEALAIKELYQTTLHQSRTVGEYQYLELFYRYFLKDQEHQRLIWKCFGTMNKALHSGLLAKVFDGTYLMAGEEVSSALIYQNRFINLNFSNQCLKLLPLEIAEGQFADQEMKLEAYNADLFVLPCELWLASTIVDLNLSANTLTYLPPEIGSLKLLAHLNLSDNQITKLPPEIGQVTSLLTFDIADNLIDSIPEEIGALKLLIELDISSNKIKKLPPEIGKLKALEKLDVSDNELTTLPAELFQIEGLHTMKAQENEITKLSSTVEAYKKRHPHFKLHVSKNPLAKEAEGLF